MCDSQRRHDGLEATHGRGGEQVQNGERGSQCDGSAEVASLVEQCGCRVRRRNLARNVDCPRAWLLLDGESYNDVIARQAVRAFVPVQVLSSY